MSWTPLTGAFAFVGRSIRKKGWDAAQRPLNSLTHPRAVTGGIYALGDRMRVQDVILGRKSDVVIGDWGVGKFARSKFPLSKAGKKANSFGAAWEWKFVDFKCGGREFVLRLLYNAGKMKAHAHLALKQGKDLTVLCSYEYHADHVTGWHLHTLCGDRNRIDSAPSGTVVHGPWVKRVPSVRCRHRRATLTKDMAGGPKTWLWSEIVRFFRLDPKGELM